MSAPPGEATARVPGQSKFGGLLDATLKVLPALGALALALYATVHAGYDSFYGKLQLAPEEVGVNHDTIVEQATAGLFFVGLLFLVAMVLVALLVACVVWIAFRLPERVSKWETDLVNRFERRRWVGVLRVSKWGTDLVRHFERHRWVGLVLLAEACGALVPLGYLAYVHQRYGTESVYGVVELLIVPIMAGGAVAAAAFTRSWLVGPNSEEAAFKGAAGLAALIAAAGASLALIAVAYGDGKAAVVMRGDASETRVGDLARFRADRVCAEWLGPDRPPTVYLQRPLMYLGQSGGEMVFYRSQPSVRQGVSGAESEGPIRLPASKLVLKPAPSKDTSC